MGGRRMKIPALIIMTRSATIIPGAQRKRRIPVRINHAADDGSKRLHPGSGLDVLANPFGNRLRADTGGKNFFYAGLLQ
jgi:hypothetical protein